MHMYMHIFIYVHIDTYIHTHIWSIQASIEQESKTTLFFYRSQEKERRRPYEYSVWRLAEANRREHKLVTLGRQKDSACRNMT